MEDINRLKLLLVEKKKNIDGNGRMGRFWQTMLLSRWKGLFSWLPVETIVREHQQAYYMNIK